MTKTFTNKNKFGPYCCQECGWGAGDEYEDIFLEDCYYKFEGDKLKVVSQDDLIECDQYPPEDYYPKRTKPVPWNSVDGWGWDWLETWLCPHCKKEFSFNNGT